MKHKLKLDRLGWFLVGLHNKSHWVCCVGVLVYSAGEGLLLVSSTLSFSPFLSCSLALGLRSRWSLDGDWSFLAGLASFSFAAGDWLRLLRCSSAWPASLCSEGLRLRLGDLLPLRLRCLESLRLRRWLRLRLRWCRLLDLLLLRLRDLWLRRPRDLERDLDLEYDLNTYNAAVVCK